MKTSRSGIIYPILFFILLLAQVCAQAATIEYLLSIGVEQINITGTSVKAMTINGSIPGRHCVLPRVTLPVFTYGIP